MTLVLGSYADHYVVLGADSLVREEVNGVFHRNINCRKLSVRGSVGVCTYGCGLPNENVHDVLDQNLPAATNWEQTIQYLQSRRFDSAPHMGALVATANSSGPFLARVPPVTKRNEWLLLNIGQGPQIWFEGVESGNVDVIDGSSPEAIAKQMLGILEKNEGADVGPPYDFIVISQAGAKHLRL
jgi:hypothetical protein